MGTTASPTSVDKNQSTLHECWAIFAEMARVLDVSAENAPEALARALALLNKSIVASQTVVALHLPGEAGLHICAAYPALVGAGQAQILDIVRKTVSTGQIRRAYAPEEGTSLGQSMRIAVPLYFEGQAFGALYACISGAAKDIFENVEHIVTVATALFMPALRAHTTALHVPKQASSSNISTVLHEVGLVGTSEAMQPVYARLAQVAPTATTVMLRGESGTGKELVARALHAASPRAQGPFVSLSCAALPESLIESELFGHEKGAFTGAAAMRKGRFELAHGGTLFLDEVGELPLLTQVKLLRVLQERSFERLGGMESRQVDIRIITATNRSLEDMVEDGRFRRDLYYRLNVFSIHLPALKERTSDILLLANHFLAKFSTRHKRAIPSIALSAADMLHRYVWPGNIRELENTMERALLLMDDSALLLPQHLPPELHSAACPFCATSLHGHTHHHTILPSGSLPERIAEIERASIIDALASQRGHIGQAANVLGLTERVLYLRMRKYGLSFQDFRKLPLETNNIVEK